MMRDVFAVPYPGQNGSLFVVKLFRNELENGGSDHLFGGVSKDACRSLIPGGDPSIQVLANDGIVTGVNDSGEQVSRIAGGRVCFFRIFRRGRLRWKGQS